MLACSIYRQRNLHAAPFRFGQVRLESISRENQASSGMFVKKKWWKNFWNLAQVRCNCRRKRKEYHERERSQAGICFTKFGAKCVNWRFIRIDCGLDATYKRTIRRVKLFFRVLRKMASNILLRPGLISLTIWCVILAKILWTAVPCWKFEI